MDVGFKGTGWYLIFDCQGMSNLFLRLDVPAVNNTQLCSETNAKRLARLMVDSDSNLRNPKVAWIVNL